MTIQKLNIIISILKNAKIDITQDKALKIAINLNKLTL